LARTHYADDFIASTAIGLIVGHVSLMHLTDFY